MVAKYLRVSCSDIHTPHWTFNIWNKHNESGRKIVLRPLGDVVDGGGLAVWVRLMDRDRLHLIKNFP